MKKINEIQRPQNSTTEMKKKKTKNTKHFVQLLTEKIILHIK